MDTMAASIVGRAPGVQTMPRSNRLGSNWVTQTPALSPYKHDTITDKESGQTGHTDLAESQIFMDCGMLISFNTSITR